MEVCQDLAAAGDVVWPARDPALKVVCTPGILPDVPATPLDAPIETRPQFLLDFPAVHQLIEFVLFQYILRAWRLWLAVVWSPSFLGANRFSIDLKIVTWLFIIYEMQRKGLIDLFMHRRPI